SHKEHCRDKIGQMIMSKCRDEHNKTAPLCVHNREVYKQTHSRDTEVKTTVTAPLRVIMG
ncbi:hypothetical protein BaRGS_00019220, partial [Batillaria attramentaria]